jgi:hypothetical protein
VDLQFGHPFDVLSHTGVLANADAEAPAVDVEHRGLVTGAEPKAFLFAQPSLAVEDANPVELTANMAMKS